MAESKGPYTPKQEKKSDTRPPWGKRLWARTGFGDKTPSLTATSGGGGSRTVLEMWSGLAAMGAGILAVAAVVLSAALGPELAVGFVVDRTEILLPLTLLLAIALPGLQTRQAGLSGRIGWAGFILAMIGVVTATAFIAYLAVMKAFFVLAPPELTLGRSLSLAIVAGPVTLVGIAVFGIATARANVLPRWAAVMFALGVPVGYAIEVVFAFPLAELRLPFYVAFFAGLAISALGLIILGHALWAHARLKKELSKRLPELSGSYSSRNRMPRTGFGDKTLWDWLQLLIVPIVLAVASFWFTLQQDTRQQATEEQRAQDAALQAYLDKTGELMLKQDAPLRESEEGDEVNTLARSRTLTVLSTLDGERKARVVLFLYESRLIIKDRPVLELRGADLSDAAFLGLANLSDASLQGVNLSNANLSGANLSGADLSGADLSGADLSNANLSNANLSGVNLGDAELSYANLSGANLSEGEHPPGRYVQGAYLGDANLEGADLSGADLRHAYVIEGDSADLYDADLRGADLRGANLWRSYFREANLSDANLSDASLQGVNLSNANLSGANLSGADLSYGANLSGANLSGADLRPAFGVTEEQLEEQTKKLEGATMPDGSKHS